MYVIDEWFETILVCGLKVKILESSTEKLILKCVPCAMNEVIDATSRHNNCTTPNTTKTNFKLKNTKPKPRTTMTASFPLPLCGWVGNLRFCNTPSRGICGARNSCTSIVPREVLPNRRLPIQPHRGTGKLLTATLYKNKKTLETIFNNANEFNLWNNRTRRHERGHGPW